MGESQKEPLLEGMQGGLFGMVAGYGGFLGPRGGVKFDRVAASYRGGLGIGSYILCFHGVGNYLIEKRGVADAYTTVGASTAAAAVSIGLTTRGPPRARMGAVMNGIAFLVPLNLLYFNWLRGKLFHHLDRVYET